MISDFFEGEDYRLDSVFNGKSPLQGNMQQRYGVMILYPSPFDTSALIVFKGEGQDKPSLRTIMIPACGSESVKSMAKELRAYAFLDKPFDIDRLVRVVKKALNKGKEGLANEEKWKSWDFIFALDDGISSSSLCC